MILFTIIYINIYNLCLKCLLHFFKKVVPNKELILITNFFARFYVLYYFYKEIYYIFNGYFSIVGY